RDVVDPRGANGGCPVLRPRELWPVPPMPRVDRLDLQDGAPDRCAPGSQGGPRYDPRRCPAWCRDDDLRVLRRRSGPVHLLHRKVPQRVRGAGAQIAMPKLTVNGKEIEVPAGTNLIEAAPRAGGE